VTDGLGAVVEATVTVGPAVALSPESPSTPPLGTVDFDATGGSGVYTFAIQLPNNSGGTIVPATGVYIAGTTGSVVDTIRVTDSLGATKTTTVAVGPAVAIAPATASTPPLGSIDFDASGGNGSYTFSIQAPTNSGGTVNPVTGLYTAGPTGSVTDKVRVTDGLGAVVEATVAVGPALAISPESISLPPNSTTIFTPSGGDGSYTFSLLVNNSGASIGLNSGVYGSGSTGNVTDTVRVTDGLGVTADAIVFVGD